MEGVYENSMYYGCNFSINLKLFQNERIIKENEPKKMEEAPIPTMNMKRAVICKDRVNRSNPRICHHLLRQEESICVMFRIRTVIRVVDGVMLTTQNQLSHFESEGRKSTV